MPRRPPKFNEFIGHKKLVDPLRQQLAGAQARNEPLPHLLLIGPSGVGKTKLAEALASESGTGITKVMGHISPAKLAAECTGMEKGDFLFIDECHDAKPPVQEMLFRVIDENKVPLPDTKSSECEVKPITLVLATDQPGVLLNALRKRFPNQIRLGYYSVAELREIVDQLATELNLLISPQVAGLIAEVSAGLPRRAKHHLQKLRLHFPDSEQCQIGLPQANEFLRAFGINKQGLGNEEREYLSFLETEGRASLESLALLLGLDNRFVRQEIEPLLTRKRLVRIGQRGRELTQKGKDVVSAHRKKRPR